MGILIAEAASLGKVGSDFHRNTGKFRFVGLMSFVGLRRALGDAQ